MSENLTAEEAVANAANTLSEKESSSVVPAKVEGGDPKEESETTEDASSTDESAETEDNDEVEDEEDKDLNAKNELWAIFQDPNQLRAFVKTLSANLTEEVKEAPKDAKQIAQAYKEELLNEIGKENEFLLEPVLKILNKLTGQIEAKATAKIDDLRRETVQKEVTTTYDNFMKDNKISKEVESRMEKISKQFPANPEVPVRTYLKHLHTLAVAEDIKVKTNEKIQANSKNANLKSLSNQTTQAKVEPRPANYTPQMAVEDAMKGIVRT